VKSAVCAAPTSPSPILKCDTTKVGDDGGGSRTRPEHPSGDEARDTPEHKAQNILGGARRRQVNPDHRLHLDDASSNFDEPQAQRIKLRVESQPP
jgi:hypothetical protein